MFFRLALDPAQPHLYITAIAREDGEDGEVYWSIYDVGKLLGKTDLIDFTHHCMKEYYSLTYQSHKQVDRPTQIKAETTFYPTYIVTRLLWESDSEKGELFERAVSAGKGTIVEAPMFEMDPKRCPLIVLGGEESIPEWINKYVQHVLDYVQKSRKTLWKKRQQLLARIAKFNKQKKQLLPEFPVDESVSEWAAKFNEQPEFPVDESVSEWAVKFNEQLRERRLLEPSEEDNLEDTLVDNGHFVVQFGDQIPITIPAQKDKKLCMVVQYVEPPVEK